MDFYPEKERMHTTTVTIPVDLANWVRANDMTFSGAFKQGIKALKERKTWNEELQGVTQNMERYRSRMIRLEARLQEIGQKLED